MAYFEALNIVSASLPVRGTIPLGKQLATRFASLPRIISTEAAITAEVVSEIFSGVPIRWTHPGVGDVAV